MSTIDLALRYAIIALAFQLACAWAHAFQSPWPVVDAFELAPTAENQLFKSLGVRFDASVVWGLNLAVGITRLFERSPCSASFLVFWEQGRDWLANTRFFDHAPRHRFFRRSFHWSARDLLARRGT